MGTALLIALSLTGCTSEEEMLEGAHCQGEALTSREDGKKVLELASAGIAAFESRYSEYDGLGVRAVSGPTAACGTGRGKGDPPSCSRPRT